MTNGTVRLCGVPGEGVAVITNGVDPPPPLLPPQEIIKMLMMSSVATAAKRRIFPLLFHTKKIPNTNAAVHKRGRGP
jgi:hypothetical protein